MITAVLIRHDAGAELETCTRLTMAVLEWLVSSHPDAGVENIYAAWVLTDALTANGLRTIDLRRCAGAS